MKKQKVKKERDNKANKISKWITDKMSYRVDRSDDKKQSEKIYNINKNNETLFVNYFNHIYVSCSLTDRHKKITHLS